MSGGVFGAAGYGINKAFSSAKPMLSGKTGHGVGNNKKPVISDFDNRGYHPQPGERTLKGFVKNNVNPDVELNLHTNSAGFNNSNGNVGGNFKRFGVGSHGGVSPHVHQPYRNISPNGVHGGISRNNFGYPTTTDVKQLYNYMNNGKYKP